MEKLEKKINGGQIEEVIFQVDPHLLSLKQESTLEKSQIPIWFGFTQFYTIKSFLPVGVSAADASCSVHTGFQNTHISHHYGAPFL